MNDETMLPVAHPHDKFFKETFGRAELARSFFQAHLPPRLVQEVAWDTLRLESGQFVDERLAGRCSDLLYSVELRDQQMLLYLLFEHQSTLDPDMPFRLLVYMVRIWEDWHKRAKPAGAKPPCILPLVLYQGAGAWTVSTQFRDWLAVPDELRGELAPYQPDFQYAVADLSQLPLDQMQGSLPLQVILALMRATAQEGLEEWLARFGEAVGRWLAQPDRAGLARVLLTYALSTDVKRPSTVEAFVGKVNDQTVKSDVMSIAEQLIQKGRQEGVASGTLIGRIQGYQGALGFQVNTVEELMAKDLASLEALLSELEGRARSRQAE